MGAVDRAANTLASVGRCWSSTTRVTTYRSSRPNCSSELEPDAYLLASATLKLPSNFQKSVIQPIKLWVEEAEDTAPFAALKTTDAEGKPEAERFITTAVSSDKVVEAQLVKKAIQFDGSTAAMERCLDDLIARMKILDAEIATRGLGFKPKAIYVCKTNIADDGEKDDASKPFEHRKAPPIRIWRYLVEDKGISPEGRRHLRKSDFRQETNRTR